MKPLNACEPSTFDPESIQSRNHHDHGYGRDAQVQTQAFQANLTKITEVLKRTIFNVSHFQSNSQSFQFLRTGKYLPNPRDSGTGKDKLFGLEIKTKVLNVNALVTHESTCKTGWKMGKEECCLSKEKSSKCLFVWRFILL